MPDSWSHVTVFVSSTWLDLRDERKAVEETLHRFRETKFRGMEYFGSRDESTETTSIEEVERAHLYIGIIGRRYGSGITEAEYRAARRKKLDCLIYISEETPAARLDPALARFRDELAKAHTVADFRSPAELAALVAADLHNWISRRWLTEALLRNSVDGVRELPTDYSTRIQNFVHEYLGAASRPVPFGGRSAEMDALDRWFESAQAYAIVAAPAGRGKSALVARWARALLGRGSADVVFFPVSIRFRTNLASVVFVSLAARLARIFGEELRASADLTAEVCRGLVASYLSRGSPTGRRIVLILDGLDEAADWEAGPDLFPMEPHPDVRVLVTARYRAGDVDATGWMETLGWDSRLARAMDLQPLTLEGLRDVLLRMGAPLDKVVAKVDVVAELFRLSEGDPLLVRLYADDLWQRGEQAGRLNPEDLVGIHPGLEGYFERWWKEQNTLWKADAPLRQKSVLAVLNLLACSLGPLMREDVLRLAPADAELNSWTLDAALEPLDRFVIGDGRQQGYVLSHPRLANYFYDRLTSSERRKWESRFLDWGAGTLRSLECGETEPSSVAGYLIQFYGAHLERAATGPDALMALVSDGWRRAGFAQEGAYTGFLNDVDRAWRAVEAADRADIGRGVPPSRIPAAVFCALCHSSVRSLAANLRPEMLAALVRHGIWTAPQALSFIRQMPSDQQRMDGLRLIPELLPPSLIDQACRIPVPELPAELAGRLAECGRGQRALEIARSLVWNDRALAGILVSIGPHLDAEDAESALKLAAVLPPGDRVSTVLAIAKSLPEPRCSEVLTTALQQCIREASPGIHELAGALGQGPARAAIRSAKQRAQLPEYHVDELLVRSALVRYLPTGERQAETERILASSNDDETGRPYPPRQWHPILANLLDGFDETERRTTLMRMIPEGMSDDVIRKVKPWLESEAIARLLSGDRDTVLRRIPLLSDRIAPEQWEVLDLLADDDLPGSLLNHICPLLPDSVFVRIRRWAFELDDYDRDYVLQWIAPRLGPADLAEAIERAWLRDNVPLCEAFARRAACLGDWPLAFDLASKPTDVLQHGRILVAIAQSCPGDAEVLRRVLAEAASLPLASNILGAISDLLPASLLSEALARAQRINDTSAAFPVFEHLVESITRADTGRGHAIAARTRPLQRTEWLTKYARLLAQYGDVVSAVEVIERPPVSNTWAAVQTLSDIFYEADSSGAREQILDALTRMAARESGLGGASQWLLGHGDLLDDECRSMLAGKLPKAGDPPSDCCFDESDSATPEEEHPLEDFHALAEAALAEDDFGEACQWLAANAYRLDDECRTALIRKLPCADDWTKAGAIQSLEEDDRCWPALADIARTISRPNAEVRLVVMSKLSGSELADCVPEILGLLPDLWDLSRVISLAQRMPAQSADQVWLAMCRLPVTRMLDLFDAAPERLLPEVISAIDHELGYAGLRSLLKSAQPNSLRHRLLSERLASAGYLPGYSSGTNRLIENLSGIESAWQRVFALTELSWSVEDEPRLFEVARAITEEGPRAYAVGEFMMRAQDEEVQRAAEDDALKLAAKGHLGNVQTLEALKRKRFRKDANWHAVASRLFVEELSAAQRRRTPLDLATLGFLASELPPAQSWPLWSQTLRHQASGQRAALLESFKPLLDWWKLDTPELETIVENLEKVLAWWP